MPNSRTTKPRRDRGWALASVLWAVTMLSLMAAATEELTLTQHRTEHRAWERAFADTIFREGLTKAVAGIAASSLEDRWPVDGRVTELKIQGVTVKFEVQNEAGRYDLNAIDGSVLNVLLRDAGLAPDAITRLADTILDWRSLTGAHYVNAASDQDYTAAGLPYGPRHAPFESVDELRLVLGMSSSLYEHLRPALTVYTKRPAIEPEFAPEAALIAFCNGNRDQAERMLDARNESNLASKGSKSGKLTSGMSASGQVFEISQTLQVSGHSYHKTNVLQYTGNGRSPYLLLMSN